MFFSKVFDSASGEIFITILQKLIGKHNFYMSDLKLYKIKIEFQQLNGFVITLLSTQVYNLKIISRLQTYRQFSR